MTKSRVDCRKCTLRCKCKYSPLEGRLSFKAHPDRSCKARSALNNRSATRRSINAAATLNISGPPIAHYAASHLGKKKQLLNHISLWKSIARQYTDLGTPLTKVGILKHLPGMLTIYEKVLVDEIIFIEAGLKAKDDSVANSDTESEF